MLERSPALARAADHLVTTARQRFRVRRAALFLRSQDDDSLVCVATAGDSDALLWVGQTLRAGVGVAGRTVTEGRPVWSPDLLVDARIPVSTWLRERLEAEDLRSVVAGPLTTQGETVGALGLLDPAGRSYTEEEIQGLAALAGQAAPALLEAWRAPSPEPGSGRAGR